MDEYLVVLPSSLFVWQSTTIGSNLELCSNPADFGEIFGRRNGLQSQIGRRNGRLLCKNPAGILHWTEKRPIIMLKSGRNIAFDGDLADDNAKIRPESRIGRRNGRKEC